MPFRRLAPALAVCVALLAACTSHAASSTTTATPTQTQSSPTRASSAAPTTTPSRTGPLTTGPNVRPGESPPVAAEFGVSHDSDGALGFATYFFRAYDWAIATGDASLLRSASASDCVACSRILARFASVAAKGQHLIGGRISLLSASNVTDRYKTASEFVIDIRTHQAALSVVDQAGRGQSRSGPVDDESLVLLTWHITRWLIDDVTAAR